MTGMDWRHILHPESFSQRVKHNIQKNELKNALNIFQRFRQRISIDETTFLSQDLTIAMVCLCHHHLLNAFDISRCAQLRLMALLGVQTWRFVSFDFMATCGGHGMSVKVCLVPIASFPSSWTPEFFRSQLILSISQLQVWCYVMFIFCLLNASSYLIQLSQLPIYFIFIRASFDCRWATCFPSSSSPQPKLSHRALQTSKSSAAMRHWCHFFAIQGTHLCNGGTPPRCHSLVPQKPRSQRNRHLVWLDIWPILALFTLLVSK